MLSHCSSAISPILRNQSLYPAELRGRGGFPPFLSFVAFGQAERSGTIGHSGARESHKIGHSHLPLRTSSRSTASRIKSDRASPSAQALSMRPSVPAANRAGVCS